MEKDACADNEDKITTPKLLQKITHQIKENEKFFSTEFFPPKTFNGATNLCAILYRLYESKTIPLFVDITWKPSEDPLSDSCREPTALLMCAASRQVNHFDTMIHIPYMDTTKTQVYEHLMKAKELGVCGIRALRKGKLGETFLPLIIIFFFFFILGRGYLLCITPPATWVTTVLILHIVIVPLTVMILIQKVSIALSLQPLNNKNICIVFDWLFIH